MKRVFIILAIAFTLINTKEAKATTIDEFVGMYPENIQSYVNKTTSIELVDDLADDDDNTTTLGITSYIIRGDKVKEGSIEIKITKGNEYSVLHELGHLINLYNNKQYCFSSTTYFENIYTEESKNANPIQYEGNALDNASEYFAESCRMFITHPNELLKSQPKTYYYIKGVFKSIK